MVFRALRPDDTRNLLQRLELQRQMAQRLPILPRLIRVARMRIDAMKHTLPHPMLRQQPLNQHLALWRVGGHAGALVTHVDLHEDQGDVAGRLEDGFDAGELFRVVDHEGEGRGAEGGGDAAEAGDGGGEEGEGVEDLGYDVSMAG